MNRPTTPSASLKQLIAEAEAATDAAKAARLRARHPEEGGSEEDALVRLAWLEEARQHLLNAIAGYRAATERLAAVALKPHCAAPAERTVLKFASRLATLLDLVVLIELELGRAASAILH